MCFTWRTMFVVVRVTKSEKTYVFAYIQTKISGKICKKLITLLLLGRKATEKFLPSGDLFYFIAKHRNCTDDILSLKFGTIK